MFLIKLLGIILCTGVASFARVRMSMSAVDIPVGGELRIKVDGTVPNIISQDFNKLRCGFLPHGSTQMDALGEYDARASRFDFPSEGQPSRFNGRISFEGNDTIKIGSIRFEDKSTIFYCILDYYVGPLKLHVETMKHQLQNVYTTPTFTGHSSFYGTIELTYGKTKTLTISVKSIPASSISCEIDGVSGVEFLSTPRSSRAGKYFVTTEQATIRNPGKGINERELVCYGVPKFGRQIEKRIFLKVKPEEATFIDPTPKHDSVTLEAGKNHSLFCSVESRLPWKVSWEILSSKLNTKQLPVKTTPTGDQHIVTREIRIIEPTKANHGSAIRCNASPNYGVPKQKSFHLYITDKGNVVAKVEAKLAKCEKGKNVWKIATIIFGSIVGFILFIGICICVKCCC